MKRNRVMTLVLGLAMLAGLFGSASAVAHPVTIDGTIGDWVLLDATIRQEGSHGREVVARALADRVEAAAANPTAPEISRFYVDNPNLFKDRRIYNIQEISIAAAPDQLDTLWSKLQEVRSIEEFMKYLKATNLEFAGSQAVRPAEQLPAHILSTLSGMKGGQAKLLSSSNGAHVVILIGSKAEPVDESRAKPAIERLLYSEAKRRLVENEVRALRAAGRVEYVGKFAAGGASVAGASGNRPPRARLLDGILGNGLAKDAEALK